MEASFTFAETDEEETRLAFGNDYYPTKYAEAIRKITSDPVAGYEQLFKGDLINHLEIRTELVKRVKKLYPNEQKIQNLD